MQRVRAHWRSAVGAIVLLSVAATVNAPRASAGFYSATTCDPQAGAPVAGTASFEETHANWMGGEGCSSLPGALTLSMGVAAPFGPGPVGVGTQAQWRIPAPTGLRFRGGWLWAEPYAEGDADPNAFKHWYGYRREGQPDLVMGEMTTAGWQPVWGLGSSAGAVAADEFVVRISCIAAGCNGNGGWGAMTARAGLRSRYIGFWIEDYAPPAVGSLGGALMEGAAQRGVQLLNVPATDQGSGIAEVTLNVNGQRYATKNAGCALAPDGRALQLAPCPTSPAVPIAVDTTRSAFSEGANGIEVCVRDYAEETDDPASLAGEACNRAGVFVDNSCDVSQAPDAADLRFGFGKRARERLKVSYGQRPGVVAKLRDAADKPVEGATVCVSTKARIKRASERDVAEVATNRRGVARVRLPKGASRTVKLTYWRDQEQVEMETATLNVRARPKLQIASGRKLSDGARARFRVKLAGPYRANREVAVQALAAAGWLNFPGCDGKTNRRGLFRCSYKFREQSGTTVYRFRAIAPRQRGYPYAAGHTRSRKIVVHD